jgi:hypothetical protein
MPSGSSTAADLTRRLLASAATVAGDELDTVTAPARFAWQGVATEFTRWLGAQGFDALMFRVLAVTRIDHPALEPIRYRPAPVPALEGITASVERFGGPATAKALEGLLESILALLGRLIGDDIVATLVERSMESWTRDQASHTAADGERRERS